MTTYPSRSGLISAVVYVPPPWAGVILGIVLIIGGVVVLADVVIATSISPILIGIVALVVGGFGIVQAFFANRWGRFTWQILLGSLYVAFGLALLSQPVAGVVIPAYFRGLMLATSGVVRIVLGIWSEAGSILLLSGVFGLLAGAVLVAGWPASGLVVLGTVLAFDLMLHGVAWLAYGRSRRPQAA